MYRMNPRYAVHETHPLTSGFSALYRMYRMYRIPRVRAGTARARTPIRPTQQHTENTYESENES